MARQSSAKARTAVRIRSRPRHETPLTILLVGFCTFKQQMSVMKRLMLIAMMVMCLSSGTFAQSYGDYAVTVDVSGNGFAHYTTIYFDDESWDPQNPPTFGWDACCDA